MKKYLLALVIICVISCSPKLFREKWTKETAPENFTVVFDTSKGSFQIEVTRKLSPKAVDRFYQLVKHHYFDNQLFYRVNPGFVAQFGSGDSINYKNWNSIKVPDEPVLQGNAKGTLSFARGGTETRTTDLFINLNDNHRLDTLFYNEVRGFPTFGKVVKGMSNVESLYDGYADNTMDSLDLLYSNRQKFYELFPKLDTIYKVSLLP
ncbi:MAG: peptidylprolyl isomerase [Maribacter sp.]|jgi:homoserine O-acetyltransferase